MGQILLIDKYQKTHKNKDFDTYCVTNIPKRKKRDKYLSSLNIKKFTCQIFFINT